MTNEEAARCFAGNPQKISDKDTSCAPRKGLVDSWFMFVPVTIAVPLLLFFVYFPSLNLLRGETASVWVYMPFILGLVLAIVCFVKKMPAIGVGILTGLAITFVGGILYFLWIFAHLLM